MITQMTHATWPFWWSGFKVGAALVNLIYMLIIIVPHICELRKELKRSKAERIKNGDK